MGMSRRGYAAHRGVSESAVRKALATGRIALEPDGTIDPARADAQWDAQTDPALKRGPAAVRVDAAAPAPTAQAGVLDAVAETVRESAGGDAGGAVSFNKAKTALEVLKVKRLSLQVSKENEKLVDRAKARAMFFDLAHRERDAWQAWPARVAANMAAELDVPAHRMEVVLDRYLRDHLNSLAEVKIDL